MSQIEVPDWVVSRARSMLETCGYSPSDSCIRATVRAVLDAYLVPQNQAQWIVEQCWEDITPEQFADLEETEAVTRTLYTLRQEKPE